jgi:hypothetical protein
MRKIVQLLALGVALAVPAVGLASGGASAGQASGGCGCPLCAVFGR